MSYQTSSDNYVWTEKNKLGQGACGAVYRAWHRDTGDLVAVKTFIVSASFRVPREIQNREFEILNGLSHENIVRLLATETVGRLGGNVALVMELCEGGSLLDVLDEPINACGLEEEEFLLVLQHLTAGIKYLRQNDIVHRDIKPGNIMRHVTDTGRSIYKIADFGTARQLDPEAEFQSLCGTEEYLSPQLYRQAVLRRDPSVIDGNRGFSAVTDLWSVGVTLYHCATGQLPFRSYEGRNTQRGREKVYEITTGKASGVISGIQASRNGSIQWSSDLPDQCRLSQGLRHLVTPLLAGLLECQEDRMWTFERYFDSSEDITARRVVYVFDGKGAGLLRIYLSSGGPGTPRGTTGVAAEFRKLVEQQTGIKTDHQLILFNGAEVGMEEEPSNKTTPSNPLFVYVSSTATPTSDAGSASQSHILPTIPEVPNSTLPEANYFYIIACCEVIHYIRHTVADLLHNSALLGAAAATYRRHLVHHMIATQRASVDKFASLSDDLATRMMIFVENESMQQCASLMQAGDTRVSEIMDMNMELEDLSERMRRELASAEELLEKSLEEAKPLFEKGSDVDSWRTDENLLRLDVIIKSLEKQKEAWKNDRSLRSLPEDRHLEQKYGRKKLPQICAEAHSILADFCQPGVLYRRKLYRDWMSKTTRLRMELKSSWESLDKLRQMRKIYVEAFDRLLLCHHPTAVLDHPDGVTNRARASGYGAGGLTLPKSSAVVRESVSTPNLHNLPNSSNQSGGVYSSSGTSTNTSSVSSTGSAVVLPEHTDVPSHHIYPSVSSSSSSDVSGFDRVDRRDCSSTSELREAQELLTVLRSSGAGNMSLAYDAQSFLREQDELIKGISQFSPPAGSIKQTGQSFAH